MGKWIYYTASLRLDEIAQRVRLATDIHKSRSLSELIQRAVSNRSKGIAEYLLRQKDERFFNALVLGVMGGSPMWHDIDLKSNPYLSAKEIERLDGALGAFVLSGGELLYAIDGQHRAVGIQKALENAHDTELANENLTVIFVPYDVMDEAGLRRTRRLFTTLNRYAKPVSKRDAVALDEDDVVAITTRRLIEEYPLFKDEKISVSHTKALPTTDRISFTTVVGLYDSLDLYFRSSQRRWLQFKRFRPSETVLNQYYRDAVAFWDAVREAFPPVDEVATSSTSSEIASKYRTREGGHLLFRPVGLRALLRCVVAFKAVGVRFEVALRQLARGPLVVNQDPWVQILYEPRTHRMLTAKENQNVAFALWFYRSGGDLASISWTADALRTELAALKNIDPKRVQLPILIT
jgi:DNA sulfur modification protein DndB